MTNMAGLTRLTTIHQLRQFLLDNHVKVDSPLGPPCWIWTGTPGAWGYGQVHWEGSSKRAHRLSYMVFIRTIPEGLHCLHHCDNRLCINPTHLYLGTNQDNNDDMMRRGRHKSGGSTGNWSLNEQQAGEIKFLALEGHLTQRDIAEMYGTSQEYVSEIMLGKSRPNVKPIEPKSVSTAVIIKRRL